MSAAPSLFDADLPEGFSYQENLITGEDEAMLVREIAQVEFSTFELRGVAARRRVAFFGQAYTDTVPVTSALPGFLVTLRDRVAAWSRVPADEFAMALINEYPAGAPIGWHRDAPQYGIVAGISLLSSCRMKFRPYLRPAAAGAAVRRTATHEIRLEPRSAYLMTAASRDAYEHHIPAVSARRYSVTFRTRRS